MLGRLPDALDAAEKRERNVYGETDAAEIERVLKSYRDFVELCARKEQETVTKITLKNVFELA